MSLMEALAAKRPDFAQRSEMRQMEAKEKALRSTVVTEKHSENLSRAVRMWKKNRDMAGRGKNAL